jgi:cytochrome c553
LEENLSAWHLELYRLSFKKAVMKTKLPLIVVAVIAFCNATAWAEKPNEETMKRGTKMAAEVCSVCHGLAGRSENNRFPKLAGQQAEYLENQLRNFKGHIRAEPDAHDFMWGVAALLDDELISGLAHYFQAQAPSSGKPGDPSLAATGKDIFRNGIPSRGVTACATCHGSNAAGNGVFPRLAGQHPEYLLKQLQLIQSAVRDVPAMHGVVKDLKPEEMEALAAYLHSI